MAKPRDTKKHKGVKWGPTYQNIALRTLVAAFNWAKGQGLISSHCLGRRLVRTPGIGTPVPDEDGFVAEPVADVLGRLLVVHAEVDLRHVGQERLVLALRPAELELAE
jgi:hypothetical protein